MSPTVLTKNEIESVPSTTGRNTPKAVAGGVRSSACVAIVKPSAPGGSIANASPRQAEGLVTDHLRDRVVPTTARSRRHRLAANLHQWRSSPVPTLATAVSG